MNKKLIASFAGIALVVSLHGQGNFQNLDFEAAQLVFIQNTLLIATTNALPGWTALSGTSELATIRYDHNDIGGFNPVELAANSVTIGGSFSMLLNGGAVSQSSLVPVDAKSLLFKAAINPLYSGMPVTLGGQSLAGAIISNGPNYVLYASDVSAFAGQTTTLLFSGHGVLDDIEFSSQTIPEPSSLALLGCGGVLLAGHWHRRRWRS